MIVSVKAAAGEPKPLHRFWRGAGGVELRVTIRNEGTAQTPSGPDQLRGEAQTRIAGESFETDDLVNIPGGIKPEQSRTFSLIVSHQRTETDEVGVVLARACVPVRSTAGPSTCREGPSFGVVPKLWVGSASETIPAYGGSLESLAGVTFHYDPGASKKQGKYAYAGKGDLEYTASGNNGACTISGHKSATFAATEAELALRKDLASGNGTIQHSEAFNGTLNCAGNMTPLAFRSLGVPIPNTGLFDLPGDDGTNLSGNRSTTTILGTTTDKWNLDAQ